MLGEQRAQPGCLFTVEHAALGGPFAALGNRHHDAVERVHVLLGRVHPQENVAQVNQHGLALLDWAQKFDLVELAHQIVEKRLHLMLRGGLGALGHRKRQRAFGRKLEPFVADQKHRLRQIERGKTGIDRKGDDPVRQRDLLVLQAVTLPAEQDADRGPLGDLACHLARGGLRGHHRLRLIVGAGGGGKQQRAIGDRLRDRLEQLRMIENMIRAGSGAAGVDVRPAVARIDDSKPGEAEIPHRARRHADVLAKLRLDQNHDGTGERDA